MNPSVSRFEKARDTTLPGRGLYSVGVHPPPALARLGACMRGIGRAAMRSICASTGVLGVSHDAADREAGSATHQYLRDRIRALEGSVRDLEGLSYGLLHDLRSPLLVIDGCASRLEQDHIDALDDDARKYVQLIHDRSQHLNTLIETFLLCARSDDPLANIVEVDMTRLARSATEEALYGHSGTHPEILIGSLPRGRGDPCLLHQAWLNLISNAIKYSSKVASPRVEIEGWEGGSESIYVVRDNGVGFDAHVAGDLFRLFKRLPHAGEFPGTGIGLAVVKRVVSRHGGRVWGVGEPNKGANFYFTLPREGLTT